MKTKNGKTIATNNNHNKPSYTISDLLTKISSLIDTCDYELALKFANRALSMDENDVNVLEILGTVELELGMLDEAREHFSKAISINPNQGYSKYLYMGQLSSGLEAINYFQSGVNLMISKFKPHLINDNNNNSNSIRNNNNNNNSNGSNSINNNNSDNSINNTNVVNSQQEENLNLKISTALCSMVEIYLTDCCFESDAESKCEEYLNQALEIDSDNPEVYQVLASVRISQQRDNEARSALQKSLEIWSHLEPGNPSIPSYDSRLSLVKLLLELSLYTQALSVLETLQKENDQVVDLWYLYGWCYYCMSKSSQGSQDGLQDESSQNNNTIINDDDERLVHLKDARDCLITCKKLHHQLNDNSDDDENDILQHAQELLQIINTLLKNTSSTSDDEDDDGVDEWEDFEEDDDPNQMEIM